jgi:hypothetical protein
MDNSEKVGWFVFASWACMYALIIFASMLSKRSWTDLFALALILLCVGLALNSIHPLVGSGLLTAMPFFLGLLALIRREVQ